MKSLQSLLDNLTESSISVAAINIRCLTNNSRDVKPNTLFIAYPGEKSDGRKYISDAIAKGAAAIVYEPSDDFTLENRPIPCIPIHNLKVMQSTIAARFYDFPSQKIPVVGVTGTNGKTSVTHFLAQSLPQCAVVGTIGYGFLPQLKKTINTTPDGLQLQTLFAELISEGAKTIAMEVSSHALSQQRVHDAQFHTAVFTNLTQDHLDYHHTIENYRDAKARLFELPELKHAVINIDDDVGRYFAEQYRTSLHVITHSRQDKNADIYVQKCVPTPHGFDITLKTPWGNGQCHFPLIGEFNIDNALAVIGVMGLLDIAFDSIIQKLSQLRTVNGRMQLFHLNNTPTVIVDYAHTPDALEKALKSVRSHCSGKIWCVFGCGGDRDKTKRPKMGAIAADNADHVIITNDNPRSESPEIIAKEIMSGMTNHSSCVIELNRQKAIEKAIQLAATNDWILVAGKGHETEQIMGDTVTTHNDGEVVMHQLQSRTYAQDLK